MGWAKHFKTYPGAHSASTRTFMIPWPPTTAWRWSLDSEIAVNEVACPRLAKLNSATTPCFPREDMWVQPRSSGRDKGELPTEQKPRQQHKNRKAEAPALAAHSREGL